MIRSEMYKLCIQTIVQLSSDLEETFSPPFTEGKTGKQEWNGTHGVSEIVEERTEREDVPSCSSETEKEV